MVSEPSEKQWKVTRSFARFALEVPVAAMLSESASIPISSGKTRDISLGGVGTTLEPPVMVGQRLWLEFQLPGSPGMRLLCKVRHDYGQRFGFQFLDISQEQRDLIRQACQGLPNI